MNASEATTFLHTVTLYGRQPRVSQRLYLLWDYVQQLSWCIHRWNPWQCLHYRRSALRSTLQTKTLCCTNMYQPGTPRTSSCFQYHLLVYDCISSTCIWLYIIYLYMIVYHLPVYDCISSTCIFMIVYPSFHVNVLNPWPVTAQWRSLFDRHDISIL